MKIEDICTRICSGGTPKSGKAEYYENGTIPWLNTKEINFNRIQATEAFITEEGLNNSSAKWIKPHAVIVAMYGATAGRVAVAEIPLTTNQACCNLEVDETIADYRYIYYWLKQNFDNIAGLANGGAQQNLSAKVIRQIEINLPDLIKQRSIANFLDSFDSKIEANAKLNSYLEELARAMYVSVMQEHADIASLYDMAEFNPETYSPKENWSAVSYIDTSALTLNDLAGLQHFNPAEEKLPTRARRKVSNGDILYSTVRPNQNHYGLLYNPEPHTLASSAFAVIRPNDTIMSPLIYLTLTDVRITKTLQQLAETSTSTIPSIRPVDLEQIAVLVPSDEYGNEIASQIETTFKQIDCNKRENRKLTALRDALLPKLMSGEIDVSTVDLTQLNSHLYSRE
ncbi:MAG: restriction endonuclease subunit S [Slackia sp.]|nr:restriction endonuclease subunit S [Slackia sp.]